MTPDRPVTPHRPVIRPHDLGGRRGFGPVPVQADQPWTEYWQRLASALGALTAQAAGINGDAVRDTMERIPSDEYFALGYSGRWLRVAERCAVEAGLVAEGEVDARALRFATGETPSTLDELPDPVRTTKAVRAANGHNRRQPGPDDQPPHFAVGQPVRALLEPPSAGHTRLPMYLRGHRGTVVAVNDLWLLPDIQATGGPETPVWV